MIHTKIPSEVWAAIVLECLDARDVITLHAAIHPLLLPGSAAFVARKPILQSDLAWFAEHGISVRSAVRNEFTVDTAKEDFDRFSHFHSWYKHMSLSPQYDSIVVRRKGQQHRYDFIPVDDEVGFHWQIWRLRGQDQENRFRDKLKVHLNFFLMRTWERYGDDTYDGGKKKYGRPQPLAHIFWNRGGSVFSRYKDKINALIADKYPHLPPFSIETPESLHAVMRLEYDRMYREFLAAAQQCIDRNESSEIELV